MRGIIFLVGVLLAASSPIPRLREGDQGYVVPDRLQAPEHASDFSGAYATVWGGEVFLDFAVDPSGPAVGGAGRPTDIRLRRGGAPFASLAIKAVRDRWVLHFDEEHFVSSQDRVAVVFQFRGALLTPPKRPTRTYDESAYDFAEDRPPMPVRVVEPHYPVQSIADGLVVLAADIDRQGRLVRLDVLKPVASLTEAAMEAVRQWEFLPGISRKQPTDSALLVAIYFRRPMLAPPRRP